MDGMRAGLQSCGGCRCGNDEVVGTRWEAEMGRARYWWRKGGGRGKDLQSKEAGGRQTPWASHVRGVVEFKVDGWVKARGLGPCGVVAAGEW